MSQNFAFGLNKEPSLYLEHQTVRLNHLEYLYKVVDMGIHLVREYIIRRPNKWGEREVAECFVHHSLECRWSTHDSEGHTLESESGKTTEEGCHFLAVFAHYDLLTSGEQIEGGEV